MSERAQQFLVDLILAWTPFLVVFLAIPLAVFVPNKTEFEHDLTPLAAHIAVAVLAIVPLLALIWLKPDTRSRLATALFLLGLFLLVSDMIAPLQWGAFDGTERLDEPLRPTLTQFGLAILFACAWYFLPTKLVRTTGVPIVCTLLAFQLYALTRVSIETMSVASAAPTPASTKPTPSRHLPNVYHVVFDAYSSLLLLDNLDALGLRDELNGFTFFPNNLANYPVTDMSVPSFMTGTLFKGGSLNEFQQTARTSGLRGRLQEAGYRVSVYVPDSSHAWMFDTADHAATESEFAGQLLRGSSIAQLAQITLVRVAPNPLRKEALAASNRLISKLTIPGIIQDTAALGDPSVYKYLSVPFARRFIQEEQSRPKSGQYVYLHVLLPHPPYIWDESCTAYKRPPKARAGYNGQSLCSIKLLGEILAELKKLDRYGDSVIIVQSDHGIEHAWGTLPATAKEPKSEVDDRIAETTLKKYRADTYFHRLHALLLIKKPSGEADPLQISKAHTQLADIPATVYDMLDIEPTEGAGISVFSQEISQPRERQVFTAHQQMDSHGKHWWLGVNLDQIDIAHFGYSPETGWRVYPNVKATP